jgi:hypothetical protein
VAVVNTMMTELQLTSAPGAVDGLTMLVNLTPGTSSTGQIDFLQTVNGEAAIDPSCGGGTMACEGTFTSFFDVFFSLSFEDAASGASINCTQLLPSTVCNQEIQLNGSGSWTDDNGAAWLVGNASYSAAEENHVVAQLPEPASCFLFGTGLAGLIVAVRRRRSS